MNKTIDSYKVPNPHSGLKLEEALLFTGHIPNLEGVAIAEPFLVCSEFLKMAEWVAGLQVNLQD